MTTASYTGPDAYQHRFRSGLNMDGDWMPWRDGLKSAHFGKPYYQERELVARTPLTEASPELLAALESIVDLTKPGQTVNLSQATDIICDVWNAARAAILKVTGEPA